MKEITITLASLPVTGTVIGRLTSGKLLVQIATRKLSAAQLASVTSYRGGPCVTVEVAQ